MSAEQTEPATRTARPFAAQEMGRPFGRRDGRAKVTGAATYAADPVARTSSVPKRSGGATTRSTGTPSTVKPRVPGSITATICGSTAKRASIAAGSVPAQTTARCSQESRHRRGSPAAWPAWA